MTTQISSTDNAPYLPTPPALALTNAGNQAPTRNARRAEGRRRSVVSYDSPLVQGTAIKTAPSQGPRIEVKRNGRFEEKTRTCRRFSLPSGRPEMVRVLEPRRSKEPQEPPLGSGDDDEGYSGSDGASDVESSHEQRMYEFTGRQAWSHRE